MIEVLNLGAGVQSTTVLLKSIEGELPRLDHAIFADTGWEPQAVYDHLERLKQLMADARITYHQVSTGDLRADALLSQVRGTKTNGQRWAAMPLFTLDRSTGAKGMIRRQCTYEYKIRPIQKQLAEIIGKRPNAHWPKEPVIRQWFGISIDEWHRMRTPERSCIEHCYPLVDKKISRNGCLSWLEKRGWVDVPRSACIGCPFRHNSEWRQIRQNPAEWADAVEFDRAIRKCDGMRGDVFLHADRVPLDEANLGDQSDQLMLWQDECEGMCGT